MRLRVLEHSVFRTLPQRKWASQVPERKGHSLNSQELDPLDVGLQEGKRGVLWVCSPVHSQ